MSDKLTEHFNFPRFEASDMHNVSGSLTNLNDRMDSIASTLQNLQQRKANISMDLYQNQTIEGYQVISFILEYIFYNTGWTKSTLSTALVYFQNMNFF